MAERSQVHSKLLFWLWSCVSSWRCVFKSKNVALAVVPITEDQYAILNDISSELDMSFEEAVFHVWNRNYGVFGHREISLEDHDL